MGDFRKLKVWNERHLLTLEIYKLTSKFPDDEKFGIITQMRRAASSIPANIVEGNARKSEKEFKHFLTISRVSTDELNYFLLLSKDLNFIDIEKYNQLTDKCSHIAGMLNNLIKKL